MAALFASCGEEENVPIVEKQTPPLAGCIYNYEDSAYVGELWFSPDEPIFVYTHTTPQGGGYITAGIQYELIFPYVFFDPTETPQIDIKKIKACIRSDFHIHNLRTVLYSLDSLLTNSIEIGFPYTQSSGSPWTVVYCPQFLFS